MRKAIGIGGFGAIAIALMFLTTTVPTVGAVGTPETTVDLIAGQNQDAGYVHVYHDGAFFYVDIVMENDWVLTESHVAMSVDENPDNGVCDLAGIPQNKQKKPVPGHFPYEAISEDSSGASYKIAFDNIGYGDYIETFDFGYEICMAVHAVVEKGEGDSYQEQTAWGEGTEFGKSWAMYFCWIPSDDKVLSLPSKVTATIHHHGGQLNCGDLDCYWRTTVTSGGSGNLPTSDLDKDENNHYIDYYVGWCIDIGDTIDQGSHDFDVYAYYDTNMPSDEKTNHWNEINYFLNHKTGPTPTQFQRIIWYYCHEPSITLTTAELAYVAAAEADGATTFIPQTGDWAAVILQHPDIGTPPDPQQSIIIEVDP